MNFYIEANKDWGLGNFITCTPAIRLLHDKYGEPVPVLFNNELAKSCYLNSPYIKHIDKPDGMRLFGSDLINRGNDMTDYEYISRTILDAQPCQPFIDDHGSITGKYGVFINGSGSNDPEYIERKTVDEDTQLLIAKTSGLKVFGCGSIQDKTRNIFPGIYGGDIRECLKMVKGAKWVITNACGFYHVAGAYGKHQLCLWKDCKRPRNENINSRCINANKEEWNKSIVKFLKSKG